MNRSHGRKVSLGITAALMCGTALLSGSAMAADLPETYNYNTAPGFTWSGLYFGINGGIGWATSRHTDSLGTTTGDFDQSGGLIGGTIGYNWQVNNIVFGIEGDWDFAGINGSTTTSCAVGCKTDLTSFGTLRPRIGYAFDRFMPYVTGGLAWGLIDAGQPGFYKSSWEAGWTVGAGVEAAFTQNLSAKLEYLYADLADGGYRVAIPVNASEKDISILRLGVNYRFSGNPFGN